MLCFFQGLGFQVPGRDVNGLVTRCFSEVGYERTNPEYLLKNGPLLEKSHVGNP